MFLNSEKLKESNNQIFINKFLEKFPKANLHTITNINKYYNNLNGLNDLNGLNGLNDLNGLNSLNDKKTDNEQIKNKLNIDNNMNIIILNYFVK